MSIRLIAKDLYRLIREIETMQKELAQAPEHKKEIIEDQIRKLKAERNQIASILEGAKEPPTVKKPI